MKWQSTPVFLPGEFHGQRSLEGYSPQGGKIRQDWVTNTFTFFHIKKSVNKGKYSQSWASQVVIVAKNSPDNAGDTRNVGSIPGLGSSPGEGNGTPLPYFCLENPMEGGAWWATVHGVAKSRTRLSDFIFSYLSLSDLLHLVWSSLGPSMLLQMALLCAFLMANIL